MEFPVVDCTAKCYGVCDALVLFALRCRNLAKTRNLQWSNPLFTPKVAHSLRNQQSQMSTIITGGVRRSKTDVEEVSLVQLFSSIWNLAGHAVQCLSACQQVSCTLYPNWNSWNVIASINSTLWDFSPDASCATLFLCSWFRSAIRPYPLNRVLLQQKTNLKRRTKNIIGMREAWTIERHENSCTAACATEGPVGSFERSCQFHGNN